MIPVPANEPKTDGPISEKTAAILAAIDRIDKKIDMIIEDKNGWRAMVVRSLKQFISLIEPKGQKHN